MEKVLDKIVALLRDVAEDRRFYFNGRLVEPDQITRGSTGGGPSLDVETDEDPQ